jgi:hypothetical protein
MRRRPDRGSTRRLELEPLSPPMRGTWPKSSKPQLRTQSPPGMRTPRLPSADDHLSCQSRRGAARCRYVHGDWTHGDGGATGHGRVAADPVPAILPAGLGALDTIIGLASAEVFCGYAVRQTGWSRIIDGHQGLWMWTIS